LVQSAPKDIKIVTLAAEFPASTALIALLKKNKIIPALGHTNSGIEQARRAVDAGAIYTTHVFNRMSGISARNPGVITEILLDDRITAEVIADGHHVHPDLLKLLVKNKSADSIVLATDSVAAMETAALKVIAGVYRMENQTIAGSRLTMLQAVKKYGILYRDFAAGSGKNGRVKSGQDD
jgi:N-acetylglucosamine-6-phosphate deacetylase